jgi:DNA polymerase III subunit chi
MSAMAAAPEVWFYLLERSSVEEALPPLLDKCLQRGWRALVRSPRSDRLAALDAALWTWRDESWLPHAQAGAADDARQPILLTTGPDNGNAAQAVFVLDGAQPVALDGVERVIALFDGRDETDIQAARAAWRTARDQGQAPSFWKQSGDGRWERQGS